MGSRVYNSASLISFAVVAAILVFLAPSTEAKFRGINDFCRTADYRALCTIMVRDAATWHDAVANSLHSALSVAEKMDRMIPVIAPILRDLPTVSRKSTIETCRSNFDSAVDNLKQALDALEQNDKGSVNIYLSAVSTSDCSDAFEQFRTIFPRAVGKISRYLDKQIGVCLAVTQQI